MLGWILGALAVGCVCSAVSESRSSSESSSSSRRSSSYSRSYYEDDDDYYSSSRRSSYDDDDEYEELRRENRRLKKENEYLRVTFNNHRTLLADFEKVNSYAKKIGYRGAPAFFYYLAENHDSRFKHFARFLDKARHMRNEVAHEGKVYNIDQAFLDKLKACVKVCEEYKRLPYGQRLYLS